MRVSVRLSSRRFAATTKARAILASSAAPAPAGSQAAASFSASACASRARRASAVREGACICAKTVSLHTRTSRISIVSSATPLSRPRQQGAYPRTSAWHCCAFSTTPSLPTTSSPPPIFGPRSKAWLECARGPPAWPSRGQDASVNGAATKAWPRADLPGRVLAPRPGAGWPTARSSRCAPGPRRRRGRSR
jgi:hypothetical protein